MITSPFRIRLHESLKGKGKGKRRSGGSASLSATATTFTWSSRQIGPDNDTIESIEVLRNEKIMYCL